MKMGTAVTMATATAVSFAISHPSTYTSPATPTSFCTIHIKHANTYRNFCRLKNGGGIRLEASNGAAVQSLMVTRCSFNVAQLELSSPALNDVSDMFKESISASSQTEQSSNIKNERRDKMGRFRSPRAARELALLVLYAACVEGSDPLRLFERRLKMKNASCVKFDQTSLENYDHMRFSEGPLFTETEEQARVLEMEQDEEALKEAIVLAAPLKLVYNKFVLSMSRKILEAVVKRWDQQVIILDETIPSKWKDESSGRILELCLLHMAMAEIVFLGTRYQVVINEAIDLAKRFCDGAAPRIINGCLRSFIEKENLVAGKCTPLDLTESQPQNAILETS
eukprot:Gb_23197 [translate_table: standard]